MIYKTNDEHKALQFLRGEIVITLCKLMPENPFKNQSILLEYEIDDYEARVERAKKILIEELESQILGIKNYKGVEIDKKTGMKNEY